MTLAILTGLVLLVAQTESSSGPLAVQYAGQGRVEVMQTLLAGGAQVDARARDASTGLMSAASQGFPLPSSTRPFRMSTSYAGVCDRRAAAWTRIKAAEASARNFMAGF